MQAKRLAQSDGGGRYGAVHSIVSSSMRRAWHTAEQLREVLGHDVVIEGRPAELDRGWKECGITPLTTIRVGRARRISGDPVGL
ncbi:histidine phosphatase family protein [Gordonia oryzae]|uniref:histidine phosphatase family protein n=1 Tax=Gordonia oryzae TaxID=2487349 RepID=UPI001FE7D558|nr:histidine phosphatase family protein [Gordonia oryzae]